MRPNPKTIARLRKVRAAWHQFADLVRRRSKQAMQEGMYSAADRRRALACTNAPDTLSWPPASPQPTAQVMESAFSGVGSHHFSTEGAGGDDMFPYVSFTLNIEG